MTPGFATLADLNANLQAFGALDERQKLAIFSDLCEKKIRENPVFVNQLSTEKIKRVCQMMTDSEMLSEAELLKVLNDDAQFSELVEMSLDVKL